MGIFFRFFGCFCAFGGVLMFFLGYFLPEDAAPHIRRRSALCSALCSALAPHLCRTCAALVPHLFRTVGGSAARPSARGPVRRVCCKDLENPNPTAGRAKRPTTGAIAHIYVRPTCLLHEHANPANHAQKKNQKKIQNQREITPPGPANKRPEALISAVASVMMAPGAGTCSSRRHRGTGAAPKRLELPALETPKSRQSSRFKHAAHRETETSRSRLPPPASAPCVFFSGRRPFC